MNIEFLIKNKNLMSKYKLRTAIIKNDKFILLVIWSYDQMWSFYNIESACFWPTSTDPCKVAKSDGWTYSPTKCKLPKDWPAL